MRIQLTVREAGRRASGLLHEIFAKVRFSRDGAGLELPDSIVREQIGEVGPQTRFEIMAVCVLQPLYGADGFLCMHSRFEFVDPLLHSTV